MSEVWYVWRELTTVSDEDTPRLLIPCSDPHLHEYPFDMLFETPEQAVQARADHGFSDEDWLLCRQVTTNVEIPRA
jgi:hypothetical protein